MTSLCESAPCLLLDPLLNEMFLNLLSGDTFVIYSRARGWWVVQRDPGGTGNVEVDTSKQGWVPAGCLLETSVPVATAVGDARTARASSSSPPTSPVSKTPILPQSILSTSFPGVALMDYKKKGDEELAHRVGEGKDIMSILRA